MASADSASSGPLSTMELSGLSIRAVNLVIDSINGRSQLPRLHKRAELGDP